MTQREKALRMALAAADAAVQAAGAAVRAAHALISEDVAPAKAKCPNCGSENLMRSTSMTGTQTLCGDCGEPVQGE